ncbi:TPR domain-containing protein [Colletotrichum chrysophilum]|uniref:TPR domain-containing protein n=1 Tax=Colletotrichum chrysophilum TaxID=1836956 RepID=A0AAD9E9Y8_9PEZI|nr:TPR domain-containing protein [Colletotrichum chrysophilum]
MSSNTPSHFALLVGIDLYSNDGSRKDKDGNRLSLNNLHGCVKDVQAIRAFLHEELQLAEPSVLTSSPAALAENEPATPAEPPNLWPTFANIKREFDAVYNQAEAGDFFYFHFSGHGAELPRINESPNGRPKDPSLLTADFCCGEPAVRGWQLNQWLKSLSDKNIHVVVTLDSCHSGGAWRDGDHFRTPVGWTTVLNLPADEVAVKGAAARPNLRDGELEKSWSINPDRFTLMTACESHEKASDRTINHEAGGAFTHALLGYLKQQPAPSSRTYRVIRDHIANQVSGQNPRVFGRDRLLFLGTEEPFSATPLVGRIEEGMVHLPIGRVHGVQRGSEFTFPPTGDIFVVDVVDEFQCRATGKPKIMEVLRGHIFQVFPSKWNFGEDKLHVLVNLQLGNAFSTTLRGYLEDRIASDIEIIQQGVSDNSNDSNCAVLRLEHRGDNGIDIFGPASLIGYEGPVRGLNVCGNNIKLAITSAATLAHLARFKQILNLRSQTCKGKAPFEFTMVPENAAGTPPFSNGQKFNFALRNTGDAKLYFTAVVLGPGFHVRQLFPTQDSPGTLHANETRSFAFSITIPDELKRDQGADSGLTHRDIIRTIVTRNQPLSWRSLELPDIWNASQIEHTRVGEPGRDATLEQGDFACWMEDEIILTRSI